MSFTLTNAARLATMKVNLDPQIVLEIEGVDMKFGVQKIYKSVEIGDEGLEIGDYWLIGGDHLVANQEDLITLTGTTTAINQQLDPSKGLGSSISSMAINLVDQNEIVTKLITPGLVVDDILGRRAKVRFGFQDTSYPADYVTIFRGIVDDIQAGAGYIKLNLAHPDQKKRQTLFTKQTVIPALAGTTLLVFEPPYSQMIYRNGAYDQVFAADPTLKTYFIHGDEYMRAKAQVFGTAYDLERAQLGTTHNTAPIEGAELETFYVLEGNVIDIALKLMLSTRYAEPYAEHLPISSLNWVSIDETIQNGVYLTGVDLVEEYGARVGDYVTILGSAISGNDTMLVQVRILSIDVRFEGTLIVVDKGVAAYNYTITEERTTTAKLALYSQYNTLGVGLGMKPDEVDIDEHLRIQRLFLSGVNMRFYMKDEVNIKEFIEQQLYAPVGAYALPRKSKASIGMHVGPIPGNQAAIISADDVISPDNLVVRRGIGQNFMNTVIYKYGLMLTEDDYESGEVVTDEDSINRIKVGTKAQIVQADGLRADLDGKNIAQISARRRLNRYKFAAESIDNIQITYAKGFNIEVGDIILFDGSQLNLLNSKDGNRKPSPKLVEVINKTFDIKGTVRLSIVDTSYSTQNRYALISPSSVIKQGLSQTKFVIQPSFGMTYGSSEYLKWSKLLTKGSTIGVRVRSVDSSTRNFETTIKSINGNTIEVLHTLGFTPQAGDILEFADYDFEGTSAIQKSLYGYMQDAATFPSDGGLRYSML